MAENTGAEAVAVTEDRVAEVTAKLMQWSETLPEAEQLALASILEAAVGADDTRGHIIIVGGSPASLPDIIRGGVLRGIFESKVGPAANQPAGAPGSSVNLSE
ncbi:MAG TPA: hypothetical protein VFV93_12160 [Thermomicrobiales bacterium]|nr:hypothetical protein [Thermomicrobiales bacterium]